MRKEYRLCLKRVISTSVGSVTWSFVTTIGGFEQSCSTPGTRYSRQSFLTLQMSILFSSNGFISSAYLNSTVLCIATLYSGLGKYLIKCFVKLIINELYRYGTKSESTCQSTSRNHQNTSRSSLLIRSDSFANDFRFAFWPTIQIGNSTGHSKLDLRADYAVVIIYS